MKADYKNWMPKGMVASFIGGTAGALAIVPTARLLMPNGLAKSVVTAASAAAGCAFGGASISALFRFHEQVLTTPFFAV